MVRTVVPPLLVSVMRRLSGLLLCALLVPACGDDGADVADSPSDGGADAAVPDGGVDVVDGGMDGSGEGSAPVCEQGLDLNGDGVCDRALVDWSREARVPAGTNREDIYNLGEGRNSVVTAGIQHALVWPITVSGVLLPWGPMATMLDPETTDPDRLNTQAFARQALGFGTIPEMLDWVGIPTHDGSTEVWPGVAWPEGVEAGHRLGFGVIDTPGGEALTFSCATCHSANLFGRTVFGLTNRQTQANEFFHLAAGFFPALTEDLFVDFTDANEAELALFLRTQRNLDGIGSVPPAVRGLDTSLAQVSLSLSRRNTDPYATRNRDLEVRPPDNLLEDYIADSKPAVWWTLKYKTRWLSDGSIVSGNPIFTNFLWNELGRGTDLVELEQWLQDNMQIVDELTVAAFAAQPPLYTDFFGEDAIDIAAAQRGEDLFNSTCASCHGTYNKNWDLADAASMTPAEMVRTAQVTYFEQTPVLDVGTDIQRAFGMTSFTDRLNGLAISQWMETLVEVQTGYVPPPLDGIWARYPYLHNQSVPTLCDLLSPGADRPASFWMGPSDNADTDYDTRCIGYPTGDAIPESWKEDERAFYDTTRPGLGNQGHDEWLTNTDGTPRFTESEVFDLIEYLKTL